MFKSIYLDLTKDMKSLFYLCLVLSVTVMFTLSSFSLDSINASSESAVFGSEHGSIMIVQSKYLKPKYVHEPIELHISGIIENYQRAESTILTITPPSQDVIENVIRPTREYIFVDNTNFILS